MSMGSFSSLLQNSGVSPEPDDSSTSIEDLASLPQISTTNELLLYASEVADIPSMSLALALGADVNTQEDDSLTTPLQKATKAVSVDGFYSNYAGVLGKFRWQLWDRKAQMLVKCSCYAMIFSFFELGGDI